MAIFWAKILQNRYHSLKITLSCYTSLKAEFWEDFEFLRVKASKRTQKIKLCFNLKKKFWYELFAYSFLQKKKKKLFKSWPSTWLFYPHIWVDCAKSVPCPVRHAQISSCLKVPKFLLKRCYMVPSVRE